MDAVWLPPGWAVPTDCAMRTCTREGGRERQLDNTVAPKCSKFEAQSHNGDWVGARDHCLVSAAFKGQEDEVRRRVEAERRCRNHKRWCQKKT